MEARLDETPGDVLDLLARLDKKVVSGRNLDGDAVSGVAGPDVKARIPGAPVDGEEVEVCVKSSKDSILLAVLVQIRSCGGKKMWSIEYVSS